MSSTTRRRATNFAALWAALPFVAVLLWPVGALTQRQYSTLKWWNACPTIQHTADCEAVKAGSLVIVERIERASTTRCMCNRSTHPHWWWDVRFLQLAHVPG